jgi:hypothetical protein
VIQDNPLRVKQREYLRDRQDILARYGVESLEELEASIAQGAVAEHPAWEDLITVENLTVWLKELDAQLNNLRSEETSAPSESTLPPGFAV